MIRFIIKHEHGDTTSGIPMQYENFVTIDINLRDIRFKELEKELTKGGIGENGFHIVKLIGAEVIEEKESEISI